MAQLSFVIVSGRTEIGAALEQTGHALVKASVSQAGSLAEAVQRHRPDALFLDLIEDADARLDELFAKGVDPGLLTKGTGKYEWKGFLSKNGHPHGIDPKDGTMTNWNQVTAKGFGSADDQWGRIATAQVADL